MRISDNRPSLGRGAARRGFTLAELMLVIIIILVVVSLTLVAVNAAITSGKQNASQVTVQSIGLAISQFEQQFGFPPPLIQDGVQAAMAGAMTVPPVQIAQNNQFSTGEPLFAPPTNPNLRVAAVYNPAFERNRRFLEGLEPVGGPPSLQTLIDRYTPGTALWRTSNQRYSKYSLGYYLASAMPSAVDGVDGPGMVRPLADGTFQGVLADSADRLETSGRTVARDRFEPFFDPDRGTAKLAREYFDIDEYREHAGDAALTVADPSAETDWRHAAIVDGDGKAYRYYRWEPLSDSYGLQTTATCQLNIPYVLVPEEAVNQLVAGGAAAAARVDVTGGNAALRGARWAVVGAGPDGMFGTEPFDLLRQRLPTPETGTDESSYRALAKSDNVVEVGR